MEWFLVSTLAALLVTVNGQGCTSFFASYPNHTMCIYKQKECPRYTLMASESLTCDQKVQIVNLHNELRQQIANGEMPDHPEAANMAEMVWDAELAQIAQRWADHCVFGKDSERRVPRFNCGQNVQASQSSYVDTNLQADMSGAFGMWINEKWAFDSLNIDPYSVSSDTRHYTQIIWADTYALGCGYTMWNDGKTSTKMIVCNYGPLGNLDGGSLYKIGTPNCAAYGRTDSPRYPGLCVVPGSNPPGMVCPP